MLKWNRLTRQYLVCPPSASVTALIFLCIKFIRAFILLMGILSHSFNKAALNWSRVAGAFRCPLTLLSVSPHRCSIGDKSGLYGGQLSGLMLWLARKSWQTLATMATNPWDIPPQTIADPPPNLSLSRTQASAKRSPRCLYTWGRPSGRKRVNRDSSVKKTSLHCLIGNCLGPCAANWNRTWHDMNIHWMVSYKNLCCFKRGCFHIIYGF